MTTASFQIPFFSDIAVRLDTMEVQTLGDMLFRLGTG